MPTVPKRARIFSFPHQDALFDAHLDDIAQEPSKRGADIVFDFQRLTLTSTPELVIRDGKPLEVAEGEYTPMRLRFRDGLWLRRTGIFSQLAALPNGIDARRIFGILHTRQPQIGEFYWITMGASEPGELMLRARGCAIEERAGTSRRVTITRNWAFTPPSPVGPVPHRPVLYWRYGGDPIRIFLGNRMLSNRLFIGGLHHQHYERPAIDHVLNLCGIENDWCVRTGRHENDRYAWKGEMGAGMDATNLLLEAEWVAERLREGKRVLVHCYAGINRSSTVCCASLMLLEGLTAEQALARVRERHPSSWPDPYHWFTLRWLERELGKSGHTPHEELTLVAANAASPLRHAMSLG